MIHSLALSALLLTAAPLSAAPAPAAPLQQAAPQREAEVRMDHISIVAVGSGDPVVLIPGLASPRAVYDRLASELAPTHRVLMVQVNGFGGDDAGTNLQGGVIDGIISDLVTYLDREGLSAPAVIGHSMGGLTALKFAADHPEHVGRVMVIDALPDIAVLMAPGQDAAGVKARAAQMRAGLAAAQQPPVGAAPVMSDPGGIWSIKPEGRIQVANWGLAANNKVVAEALYDDLTTNLKPRLNAITARPFTILYATGAGPQATALWQAEYAGSPAKLVPVADSYHFIMLDQPEAFSKAVSDFLNE